MSVKSDRADIVAQWVQLLLGHPQSKSECVGLSPACTWEATDVPFPPA